MLRSTFKWLSALLAASLLIAAVFVVNLIWFRPFSLNLFYEKIFVSFLLEQPELLSSLGIAEQFGYRRHNAHLDDVSVAKTERDFAAWHGYLDTLKSYDVAAQTPEQRLSTRVLTWFIESQLEGERFRFHDYPVNQLAGVQSQTPDFLINLHRIGDRRGAEDYLARLGEVGRKFDQVLEGLALREHKGVVPPRFVIERVLTEMRNFAGKPVAQNPLYMHFARKVEALTDIEPAEKRALLVRCSEAIETGVGPAYRRLIAFFEGQLSRSTRDDGVWKLPDGDAYYAYRLRSQMAAEFMTSSRIISTTIAPAARVTNSWFGSCVQVKICTGSAVNELSKPLGLNRSDDPAPITSSGAVSPIARDSARITPVAMPAIEPGRTCFQIVCHCVAPSAIEPSRIDGGTARIASRATMITTGRTSSESWMPPAIRTRPIDSGPRTMNARPRMP